MPEKSRIGGAEAMIIHRLCSMQLGNSQEASTLFDAVIRITERRQQV